MFSRRSFVIFAATAAMLAGRLNAAEPAAVLKEAGLVKSTPFFVLPAEANFGKSVLETKRFQKGALDAVKELRAYEGRSAEDDAATRELTQRRIKLNDLYQKATLAEERNNYISALNQATDRLNLLLDKKKDDVEGKKARDKAAGARQDFIEHVVGLRKQADEIVADYKKLADDEFVGEALKALSEADGKTYELGPSRNYTRNLKLLETTEKTVLTDEITMKPRGGTFEVDVIMNGKSIEAIFDTGASLISLPNAVAAKIGIKPTASDPTIRLSLADGRIVEGKRMSVDSVKLGKFEVKDVECAVMPDTLTDAPVLLGGSFIGNFNYHIDPDGAKLTMSRIESEETKKPLRPTKKKPGSKSKNND
ncbi:MAG: TIGR02281 family clan AA aspartic protease [Planctomycetia bacterium]